jgi:crotonobetainyl-CoA:carnitine CoA-transferase CaiB-like acyl-CoA transferase
MTAWYRAINRNKRSIAINLKAPAGHATFMALARDADVVVEGFRPGVVEALRVDYDRVRLINPKVVFCALSGYGQTGPYAEKAGYAAIGEAMGGLRAVVGYPDRPPSRVGISLGDSVAATFAALGALAALHERSVSGEIRMLALAYSSKNSCVVRTSACSSRLSSLSGSATERTSAAM